MSQRNQALVACFVALLLAIVQAVPTCDLKDESCREQLMHPVLPAVPKRTTEPLGRVSGAARGEYTNEYWREKGKDFIREKLNSSVNTKKAKNIILFLGDGMGLTTTAAARNVLGGEEQFLAFEKFPYTGLSKTYSVSHIVPDSAGTGTAYLCGVKTNSGTLGVNALLERGTCQDTENDSPSKVYSIAKWAMDAGKSGGIVTTTRITHASPAAAYAHITERNWENDAELSADCGANSGVRDIADQLINGDVGSRLTVMFGGGRRNFKPKAQGSSGRREDNRNLIDEFLAINANNKFVESRSELMNLNLTDAERVLGLFSSSHLDYNLDRLLSDDSPTLSDLTIKAIEKLSENENGYFLFVEGGRIDHAHHDNQAHYALDETVQFAKAVQAAVDNTDSEDTLIVVTADHSHAFSYSGYAKRGNDIFGMSEEKADDGKPYLTVSYANGPGFDTFYSDKWERLDPRDVDVAPRDAKFPATYTLDSETHGGDDVPIFARGPYAHLFTGVFDQNNIPHTMAYAACIGSGLKSCDS